MFKKFKSIAKVIRIQEMPLSVPFAGTAALLVSPQFPDVWRLIFLMLAVTAGFSAGNILNAWADKDIDAKNPRTADRPLVKKELSGKELLLLLAVCGIVMLACTAALDPFYILLLPIPIAICVFYCFCKRFTCFGDIVIGIAHAIAPVAGWVVFGGFEDWRAILIGAIITFFTVSLAMIYSMQDLEYDKSMGLHSFPVRFGVRASYVVSVLSNLATVALSILLVCVVDCGAIFVAALIVSECMLVVQYLLILKDERNARYAFNINQGVSSLIFIASILDKI
ncbi:MAG: 4-hydroxybenzoate octaprenyltransferase [Clostridia bacterium]|nr:4-hydroxybenzoate octaprenyltransferase [Clostridia bacterium]